ncbi:NADPH-dependent F420 reductase [Aquamicrobium sp. LC103]|uniref:NADPH-dependent F420 reductase n=1 Tax=Aquamicrobium sp. LC103 TaxID=1120658 RepID=UPI00063E9A89|nr:NADPH-dependent F420 reductase [Aquamicrobium sp. LC103]TKT74514.1 NADPH-dependent F420 reductase [Aquamicrobium sp. LC103]
METIGAVAVLGGTGSEGGGVALRLAVAGHKVIIGSRDAAKAEARAAEINARVGGGSVSGADLKGAAAAGEIVVLTVPFTAQAGTLEQVKAELEGKILVDATVPLVPPKVSRVQLPAGGSAVAAMQEKLGPGVRVVAAFQNVSAHNLDDLDHEVDCDVLIFGDDGAACDTVVSLVGTMGLRGIYGGPVCNSAAAEALTSVLIAINRRYKLAGSGIRITGMDRPAEPRG